LPFKVNKHHPQPLKDAPAKTLFLPVRLTIAKQTFNYLNKLQSSLLRKNANFYFLQLRLKISSQLG